jgi:hypothetical protein
MPWRALAVAVALLPPAGCALAPRANGREPLGELPPPGYGTLRQDEVSITLSSGALHLMVTPLDPSVTHVTAPDTYRRLSGLVERHGMGAGAGTSSLFLVSFYSDQPDVRFVPEEVQLISHGIRVRPGTIEPVTPSWGERRVGQRQTEMAVYRFATEVDLESSLVLAYGLEETSAWETILSRIRAERARARARAGIGDPREPAAQATGSKEPVVEMQWPATRASHGYPGCHGSSGHPRRCAGRGATSRAADSASLAVLLPCETAERSEANA